MTGILAVCDNRRSACPAPAGQAVGPSASGEEATTSYTPSRDHTMSHPPTQDHLELDIGIAEIDFQHRELHVLLERLRTSTDKHYDYATNVILAELTIQTRIHFAVEESLMRLLSYPAVDVHIAEHRYLTTQLVKFRQRAQDLDVSDGLSSFIQTWLLDHIEKHDRKFVAHFLQMGISPTAAPEVDWAAPNRPDR
jgi:hemerythrin